MIIQFNPNKLCKQAFFMEIVNYLYLNQPVTLRAIKRQFPFQKNIDKLLRVDDRFLLKESDFDKYKKSVDERIQKANETNRRCKPENNSLEIRFKFKDFPDDREFFISDSMFILKFLEIKPETIIDHHLLNI